MSKGINYGRLLDKAFRRFIADVLSQVAREGLPGKHHFLIVFDTGHPGVDMAQSLRDRYPDEMMILIQEWFEDLAVMKDRFSVTLNFGDVPERLVIPLDAIKSFSDPSIEWGLRFEPQEAAGEQREEHAPGAEVVSLDKFRKH